MSENTVLHMVFSKRHCAERESVRGSVWLLASGHVLLDAAHRSAAVQQWQKVDIKSVSRTGLC